MRLLNRVSTYLKDCFLLPKRMARISRFHSEPKELGQNLLRDIHNNIEALTSLLILKEISPEIVKNLLPRLQIPDDVLQYDLQQRYKREKDIALLCDLTATRITGIMSGSKSLPWDLLQNMGTAALECASFQNKTSMFHIPMGYALYSARNIPLVIEYGELFETFNKKVTWTAQFQRIWLIYLTALIADGRLDKALEILSQYKKVFNLAGVESFFGTANFAHTNRVSNAKIAASSFIYQELQTNAGKIEQILQEKTLAVVGSSSHEIGRGLGEVIDNHDLVMRFNAALNLEGNFAEDYGTRTDVVSVTPFITADSVNAAQRQALLEVSCLFMPYCCETHPVSNFLRILLYKRIKSRSGNITAAIPGKFLSDLIDMLPPDMGINISTGARTLAYLKSVMKNGLQLENIFGFSWIHNENDFSWQKNYHYDRANFEHSTANVFLAGHAHNFLQEGRFLRRLFEIDRHE